MTFKQKAFVKEYINNGGNGTQAILKTYNTEDPKTASVMAVETLASPSVKQSIDDIAKSRGIDSTFIFENMKDIAVREVEKVSADAKLKANIELARILGMYPSTKHSNININMKGNIKDLNFTEVKKELKVIDSELDEMLEEPTTTEQPITEETTPSGV